jgi:hypothetical protein
MLEYCSCNKDVNFSTFCLATMKKMGKIRRVKKRRKNMEYR